MWHQVANNPPNARELLLSKMLHGPTTQLLRLVTPPLLAVQPPTLFQAKENHFVTTTTVTTVTHLCSYGSISPTVQPLDYSVHVISHTGPYARSSERRHEQRLFGQVSDIPVVVQSLIEFFNLSSTLSSKPPPEWTVSIKRPSSHLGTTQCSTSSSIDASGNSASSRDN